MHRTTRPGGRSCSGITGGSWCAICGPPAPGPELSCGWRSAWREWPPARNCWGSPPSCAPWDWSPPATTGSWTSSTARLWICASSPTPGVPWSSAPTLASHPSTAGPSSPPNGLRSHGNHLVTRANSNSVASFPATPPPPPRPRPKGRPAKYGKKIKVATLLNKTGQRQEAPSPVYGEKGVILRFRAADLLWRPVGILVRFVVVLHPLRGALLLMCTDLTLSPLDIIRIYGLRFKIEVSFKHAIHVIGAYAYHFWMAAMTPLRRVSGNQYLHRQPAHHRNAVRRNIAAYHPHIQLG